MCIDAMGEIVLYCFHEWNIYFGLDKKSSPTVFRDTFDEIVSFLGEEIPKEPPLGLTVKEKPETKRIEPISHFVEQINEENIGKAFEKEKIGKNATVDFK